MNARVVIAVLALICFGCVSTPLPTPTSQRPIAACSITCASGYSLRRQHLCRGGTRWFEDIRIIGEYVKRAIDGSIATAVWIARDSQGLEQNYDKQDVEIGSCDSVIRRIVQGRDSSERGQHPGEDELGRPQ
jgi:hypothetical protein